jgi:hypothetical protein
MHNLGRNIGSSLAAFLVCVLLSSAAFAANDPGSFGRDVRFLDVSSQTYSNYLYLRDTTACDTTAVKCVQLSGSEPFPYRDNNIARIDLPGGAANSLLCPTISPSVNIVFRNAQTTNQHSTASLRVDVTIQSAVLNNPSLINRVTGQAFGGKIEVTNLVRVFEGDTMVPGGTAQRAITFSRQCVSGLLTIASLQSQYGLSAYQARLVFANPMTITLSAWGTLQNVEELSFTVPFRMYGD